VGSVNGLKARGIAGNFEILFKFYNVDFVQILQRNNIMAESKQLQLEKKDPE
jgi:hypothetical protein